MPRIIAGDIWACFRHLLEPLTKEQERRAAAFVEQAFEFYEAAENPHIRSRPVLYYYAFLNLAKSFLIAKGKELSAPTRHGISYPRTNERQRLRFEGQRVRIEALRSGGSPILPLLLAELGGNISKQRDFKVLDDILAQIPAIHRTYTRARNQSTQLLPVKRFDTLSGSGNVWTRLVVSSSDGDVRTTLPHLSRSRDFSHVFKRVGSPKDDEIWFETGAVPGSRRGIDTALAMLAGQIRACGLWTILTQRGYRYYFGTFPPSARLPQLITIFCLMFYLSSVARYKPYDLERIISGRHAWLVSEFLATQPEQFLYLTASTLAGVDVVRPFAVG